MAKLAKAVSLLLVWIFVLAENTHAIPPPLETVVYTARKIVTMDEDQAMATAVAVRDGYIIAVGSLDSVKSELRDQFFDISYRFAESVIIPVVFDQETFSPDNVGGPHNVTNLTLQLQKNRSVVKGDANNDEHLGRVEKGKRADFAILLKDPYVIPPEGADNIEIRGLMYLGNFFPAEFEDQ